MRKFQSKQRSSGDLDDPRYYLNRELAELAYQRRVLYQAADERNALLQRVRCMSFFTRNTDEFVMKRIGGLKQEIEAGDTKPSVDGRSPREQWNQAFDVLHRDLAEQDRCWIEDLAPALADAGIRLSGFDELGDAERERLREHFRTNLLPRLSPLAFDPAHPFPFISNLSLSLGVLTRTDDAKDPVFTRIKIPTNHPRLLAVEIDEAQNAFLPVEQLMLAHLDLLLPECEILATSVFRLTRSAEVELDQEVAEDLLERIEQVIDKRRFAAPVCLEIASGMPDEIRELLVRQHGLAPREVIERRAFLGEGVYSELAGLERPELKARDWTPQPHPELPAWVEGKPDRSIFARLREGDLFVHLPYHDFDQTVLRFFQEAARDPQVTALKTTIYRTAEDSPVVDALLEAVDSGKEVAVMVELKARFDEAKNIDWVERLQPRGVHVAYGTPGLKAHTKTTLVVREEGDGVRLYSHVGTGNYNSETAKAYSDLGILTADPRVGNDLIRLFNSFTGPALSQGWEFLLISPVNLRERFTACIRREAQHARAGRRARIVAKANALEDPALTQELYRASRAGVQIDLVLRDICRLRPGLEDVSDTVRVHSIVGHFLEHARIYYFENGGEPEWFIGSADWMKRNLDKRVEAVTPVVNPSMRAQLRTVLAANLADNRRRWRMDVDGDYELVRPAGDEQEIDAQHLLMDLALQSVRDPEAEPELPAPVAAIAKELQI